MMIGWGLYLVSQGLVDYVLLKTGRFDLVGTMFLSVCIAPALLLAAAEVTRKRR